MSGRVKVEQVVDLDAARKSWAEVAARLALMGCQAWRSDAADGPQRFFVARYGMLRGFASLDELERFAEQVGAAA